MADRYWVGGSGNWSSTAHWSATSGGASGASVPTAVDNAIFDAASNTTAYTVTVDVVASCLDLNFSAAPSVSGTVTWAGNQALSVFGNFTLLAGMTRSYTGQLKFKATSAGKTIRTNGVNPVGSFCIFDGVGGAWTLLDNFNVSDSAGGGQQIQMQAGTLNVNGFTITIGQFFVFGSNGAATLNLGAGSIICTFVGVGTNFQASVTVNVTINAGTGSIIINGGKGSFDGGGYTYYDLSITGVIHTSPVTISGNNTFHNLTLTGGAVGAATVSLAGNQTVTGTLKYLGNSAATRLLLNSSVLGTSRTIAASAVDGTSDFVDFQDIAAAGGAVPFAGANTAVGDCGGNGNITFTPALTCYWRTGTTGAKTWSTAGNWWRATNGGGGAARVPLPQDDVVFDANSIAAAGTAVSMDVPRLGKNLTFAGITNNPTINQLASPSSNTIYGSLTQGVFTSGGNGFFTFGGRGAYTLTQTVADFANVVLAAPTGSLTLLSNFASSTPIRIQAGTFNANGFNVTCGQFDASSTLTRVVNMGAGTWTITSAGASLNFGDTTLLTINAQTSTVKLTAPVASGSVTFGVNGYTWNNLWSAVGLGVAVQLAGNNTFNDVKVAAGTVFQLPSAGTTTLASLTSLGALAGGGDKPFGALYGLANSCFTTPNSAATRITGDIDIRVQVALVNWVNAGIAFVAESYAAVGNLAYWFGMDNTGKLKLIFTSNGTAELSATSSAGTGFANGSLNWVRVTRSAATGTVNFYTSADGVTWNALGVAQATTAGNIFAGTSEMCVGAQNRTANLVSGQIYRLQVLNGIAGATAVDFNPADFVTGATWVSSVGETWTMQGNAMIARTNLANVTTTGTGTGSIAKAGAGTVVVGFSAIRNVPAVAASTFFTDANSLNEGGNTNWTFGAAASRTGTSAGVATVNGIANRIVQRTATAAGAATVLGDANRIVGRTATAAGSSAVLGDANRVVERIASAAGSSTAQGEILLGSTLLTPTERFYKPEAQDRSYRV